MRLIPMLSSLATSMRMQTTSTASKSGHRYDELYIHAHAHYRTTNLCAVCSGRCDDLAHR
eukprot:m.56580 g.56580  ORF g.56580 m.56580 type:complete len:60 (-) comp11566_c0_seq6:328-507(-)